MMQTVFLQCGFAMLACIHGIICINRAKCGLKTKIDCIIYMLFDIAMIIVIQLRK